MTAEIETEIAELYDMTTGQLAEKYEQLHGQPTRTRHRQYLIRKNAWRIQANAFGGLSERAKRRAAELANDADIRVMAPKTLVCPPQGGDSQTRTKRFIERDPRIPTAGSARNVAARCCGLLRIEYLCTSRSGSTRKK